MSGEEGTSTLASSFTDMMTSLAVIFILLLVASLNNAHEGSKDTVTEILNRLARELQVFSAEGVKVQRDPRDPLALLVIVPEGLLNFEVNKSTLPAEGELFLSRFIPRLATTLSDPEVNREISSVVVEGHTDSTGADERNLQLSQERSLAVVLKAMSLLDGNAQLRSGFLRLLSATGRGKAEPILTAAHVENREKSRRVVFKIRVRSLEQKTLTEIMGKGEAR